MNWWNILKTTWDPNNPNQLTNIPIQQQSQSTQQPIQQPIQQQTQQQGLGTYAPNQSNLSTTPIPQQTGFFGAQDRANLAQQGKKRLGPNYRNQPNLNTIFQQPQQPQQPQVQPQQPQQEQLNLTTQNFTQDASGGDSSGGGDDASDVGEIRENVSRAKQNLNQLPRGPKAKALTQILTDLSAAAIDPVNQRKIAIDAKKKLQDAFPAQS